MTPARALTPSERRDWLRLARTDGVGPVTFFGLLARFGTVSAALEALPQHLARTGKLATAIPAVATVERELERVAEAGAQLICACEPLFPQTLAAIAPPPPVITVKGRIGLTQKPMVALVGARNASAAGIRMAAQLAAGLGEAGVVVVSGLARGIDVAAHRATLATGTIAVMAGGITTCYPPEHQELFDQIGEAGLIVAESPLGAQIHAGDFPRRNRIISGLASGVVVVEAEARSGSLITARFAADQGRDVMAVPGSPLDPRATGTNALIRDGARLVTSAADVLETLAALRNLQEPSDAPRPGVPGSPTPLDEATLQLIADLLSPVPTTLEELATASGLPWRTVAAAIVELELQGIAEQQHGARVARRL
jgi:DNA processing protein